MALAVASKAQCLRPAANAIPALQHASLALALATAAQLETELGGSWAELGKDCLGCFQPRELMCPSILHSLCWLGLNRSPSL